MKLDTTNILSAILIVLCVLLTQWLIINIVWQHEAVLHHAAFFESNSWGIASFHWEDVSYAQTPFQDQGWQSIQSKLFDQKLKALDIK
jgi:hypothetical protein